MKCFTKSEKDSARFHATISYRSIIFKRRVTSKVVNIKLSELPIKEYEQLLKIIETFGS
jgi:hypothetical protein